MRNLFRRSTFADSHHRAICATGNGGRCFLLRPSRRLSPGPGKRNNLSDFSPPFPVRIWLRQHSLGVYPKPKIYNCQLAVILLHYQQTGQRRRLDIRSERTAYEFRLTAVHRRAHPNSSQYLSYSSGSSTRRGQYFVSEGHPQTPGKGATPLRTPHISAIC